MQVPCLLIGKVKYDLFVIEYKVSKIDQILQLSEDSPKSVWKMQIESVKFVHD